MNADEKNQNKRADSQNDSLQNRGENKGPEAKKKFKAHPSQGHSTDAEGSDTHGKEPIVRSSTTDSSRAAKNSHDDMPEGGNIR